MTEKRFTIEDDLFIREKTTQIVMEIPFKEDCKNMCELLNAQHEENMNLRAKHTQMIIILKDVVNDLKRMDTYRYAEHLEKIANLHFLSEKELKE